MANYPDRISSEEGVQNLFIEIKPKCPLENLYTREQILCILQEMSPPSLSASQEKPGNTFSNEERETIVKRILEDKITRFDLTQLKKMKGNAIVNNSLYHPT